MLAQSEKNQNKLSARNEQARLEIEKLQEEMEDNGQNIREEAQNEVDLEIRESQAGECRRCCTASQSTNGCCFNSTIVGQFIALGAEQAMQQFAILQGELNGVYGGQHQLRQREYTKERSNQPRREEEEIGMRSRESQRRIYGLLTPGLSQPRVSGCFCSLILLCSQIMIQVKATEVSSARQEEERRPEAGSRRQKETTAKTRSRSPRGDWPMEGDALWKNPKQRKSARERTRALFKETAGERTQALLRDAAKVRATFHQDLRVS